MKASEKNLLYSCEKMIQISLRNSFSLRSMIYAAILAAVWFVLTEGVPGSWLIGLPVILVAVFFLSDDDGGVLRGTLSVAGMVAFLPFFVWQSVVSGFDVAIRSLRPDMGLSSTVMIYPLRLPGGAARRLFVNTITLMPGTLSVTLQENTVVVHVLDKRQQISAALESLEVRVGNVFNIVLEKH